MSDFCFICNQEAILGVKYTKDRKILCGTCATSMITCESAVEYYENEKNYFSTHDSEFFMKELSEIVHCGENNLSFNFKTRKMINRIGIMRKKNYQVIPFEKILDYKIRRDKSVSTSGIETRFLRITVEYAGKIKEIGFDDSYGENSKENYDLALDCLKRISDMDVDNSQESEKTDSTADDQNPDVDSFNTYSNEQETVGTQSFSTESTNKYPLHEKKRTQQGGIKCPNCGSPNCAPIMESTTSGKDFSAGKGCCGFALLGPIGILCGACGKGKQTTTTTSWVCSDCATKFN